MSVNKPIGVFDSGVGGLTVAKEIMQLLPQEKIIYFGDTARVPYGIKSKETVTKFSLESILFLMKKNVKVVVVACNTSSSLALPSIRRFFNIPIVGVIQPGAKEAVAATRNKRIGIIATRSTIKSLSYVKEIKKIDASVKVFCNACPMFVPLAEEGWLKDRVTLDIAKTYLRPLQKQKIDTLVLGCTHYPLLKNIIHKIMGPRVRLIDSAKQVAQEVRYILDAEGMFSKIKKPKHEFYVTDEQALFKDLAQTFLGQPVNNIRIVKDV